MNDAEIAACWRAIGYLEGVSLVLWNLDSDKSPIGVCPESAAFFDEQVETLRKMVGYVSDEKRAQ